MMDLKKESSIMNNKHINLSAYDNYEKFEDNK